MQGGPGGSGAAAGTDDAAVEFDAVLEVVADDEAAVGLGVEEPPEHAASDSDNDSSAATAHRNVKIARR